MPRYFIQLAYDGTPFHGWQVQENAHTVQAEMNTALSAILGEPLEVTGCGRTDTGVHASDFYAHFDCHKELNTGELAAKMNSMLPHEVAVRQIFPVPAKAHARYSATARTYKYYIVQEKDPFLRNRHWYLFALLDIASMNAAAAYLPRFTDFTSFSKSRTQVKTNSCAVSRAEWKQEGSALTFTITADRFLRGMVRAIVGTMVEIGQGKRSAEDFREVIAGKDRSLAGASAPAGGLFLTRVEYPEDILKHAKATWLQ